MYMLQSVSEGCWTFRLCVLKLSTIYKMHFFTIFLSSCQYPFNPYITRSQNSSKYMYYAVLVLPVWAYILWVSVAMELSNLTYLFKVRRKETSNIQITALYTNRKHIKQTTKAQIKDNLRNNTSQLWVSSVQSGVKNQRACIPLCWCLF